MTDPHIHLLVNHLPILGALFGLLLGLYGAVRHQPDVLRVALVTLVVVGAASVMALQSGEGAEEAVEGLPGVSEQIIHAHEEAAETANYGALALALVALGVLVWRRREPEIGRAPTAVVLVGAAAVFALMAQAGNLGGEIRHTEIRDGTASTVRADEGGDAVGPVDGRYEDDD